VRPDGHARRPTPGDQLGCSSQEEEVSCTGVNSIMPASARQGSRLRSG
jgi:hypothetical protein